MQAVQPAELRQRHQRVVGLAQQFPGAGIDAIPAIARDSGRRYVEITCEVECHRAVQDAAHGLELTVPVGTLDPLEHPVDGVGVGEDVMGRLPVGVLVGTAERATLSAAA